MADRQLTQLTINGVEQNLAVDTFDTLLSVLRDGLGLTGAKRGCNQGVCGACTVLLDGKPVRSCLTLAADCGDSRIETVEGVAEGLTLSEIQQALAETGGVQCGFCSPGMVMALTALHRAEPRPDATSVREALAGNLCRCTGYAKIVEAALRVAGAGR